MPNSKYNLTTFILRFNLAFWWYDLSMYFIFLCDLNKHTQFGVCFGSYNELGSRTRHVLLWLSSVPCGKQHNEDGIPVPSGMNRFWHPSHTSTCWQPCSKLGGVFQSLQRCASSIHEEYLGLRWRCCQLRALPTWRQAILCSTHHSHSSFKWKSFVQASRISVEWQELTADDCPHFQSGVSNCGVLRPVSDTTSSFTRGRSDNKEQEITVKIMKQKKIETTKKNWQIEGQINTDG